jgi:hypothetical protein
LAAFETFFLGTRNVAMGTSFILRKPSPPATSELRARNVFLEQGQAPSSRFLNGPIKDPLDPPTSPPRRQRLDRPRMAGALDQATECSSYFFDRIPQIPDTDVHSGASPIGSQGDQACRPPKDLCTAHPQILSQVAGPPVVTGEIEPLRGVDGIPFLRRRDPIHPAPQSDRLHEPPVSKTKLNTMHRTSQRDSGEPSGSLGLNLPKTFKFPG